MQSNHILSIQWCAVRARRRVLPIRRSVRTVPWSTSQRGQSCDVRCTKGILLIISNQYHIIFAYRCEGVGCTPPSSPFEPMTNGMYGNVDVGHIFPLFLSFVISDMYLHIAPVILLHQTSTNGSFSISGSSLKSVLNQLTNCNNT